MTNRRLAHIFGLAALAVALGMVTVSALKIGRLPYAVYDPQILWRGYSDATVASFAEALALIAPGVWFVLIAAVDPVFSLLFGLWVIATHWRTRRVAGIVMATLVAVVDWGENLFLGLQVWFHMHLSTSVTQLPASDALALPAVFTIIKFPLYAVALIWTLQATFRKDRTAP